ncbi:hypothetical protein [Nocardia sp. NPDC052566]|uniref:hypothetical protein n=1 Tax=Nocardia sp. NPDC052566 TaxID=3364330 RepID=UPI0037C7D068
MPSPDGAAIEFCDDPDKFDQAAEVLQYLIWTFFAPEARVQDHPGFEDFTFDHIISGNVYIRHEYARGTEVDVRQNTVFWNNLPVAELYDWKSNAGTELLARYTTDSAPLVERIADTDHAIEVARTGGASHAGGELSAPTVSPAEPLTVHGLREMLAQIPEQLDGMPLLGPGAHGVGMDYLTRIVFIPAQRISGAEPGEGAFRDARDHSVSPDGEQFDALFIY